MDERQVTKANKSTFISTDNSEKACRSHSFLRKASSELQLETKDIFMGRKHRFCY